MFHISLQYVFPENEKYNLILTKGEFQLSFDTNTSLVQLPEEGEYRLSIEQLPETPMRKCYALPLFILTAPIQGLFHILLLDLDSDWENDIRAYRLKGETILDVTENTSIRLVMTNSKYINWSRSFDLPKLAIDPEAPVNVEVLENKDDITFQYNRFVRKVLSSGIVGLAFLGFLLFQSMKARNTVATVVTSAVLAMIVAVVIGVVWMNKRKRDKFIQLYESEEK